MDRGTAEKLSCVRVGEVQSIGALAVPIRLDGQAKGRMEAGRARYLGPLDELDAYQAARFPCADPLAQYGGTE